MKHSHLITPVISSENSLKYLHVVQDPGDYLQDLGDYLHIRHNFWCLIMASAKLM